MELCHVKGNKMKRAEHLLEGTEHSLQGTECETVIILRMLVVDIVVVVIKVTLIYT